MSVAVTESDVAWLMVSGATGDRAIVIADVCSAIWILAITVGLATEVAVIVTDVAVGTLAGAV